MEVRGRRLFNRRPVCFFALFLAFGIIVAEGFYALPHLYRLIPLLLTAAVCVIFAAKPKLRGFLCLAVAFLTGFVSCSGAADVYDSRLVDDVSGTFTARVSGEIIVEDGTAEFYVEDLAVNGEVLEGECRVYVPMTAPDFGVGDVISIRGELVASRHEAFDSYFSSNVLNGTYFTIWADSAEFLAAGEPDFILGIQLEISRLFYEHMDEDASVIARALVIGDKRGIDDLLYGDVQASGLAHVLAVSGLHITALASAVYWLFRKLGINPKIALVVVLAISLFYIALCDFVPPAVRAFVMTAVFNFGSAFGYKRDGLSALGFAAAAIMIFSPFSLMHVGFLLSVFSLLGIMAFADPIKKFFMKGVDKIAPQKFAYASATITPARGLSAVKAGRVPETDVLEAFVAEKENEEEAVGGKRGKGQDAFGRVGVFRRGNRRQPYVYAVCGVFLRQSADAVHSLKRHHIAVHDVYLSVFADYHADFVDYGSARAGRRGGLADYAVHRVRACGGRDFFRFRAGGAFGDGRGLRARGGTCAQPFCVPEKVGEDYIRPRHRDAMACCRVRFRARFRLTLPFFSPPQAYIRKRTHTYESGRTRLI